MASKPQHNASQSDRRRRRPRRSRPGADRRPCRVKDAIDLARKAKTDDATAAENTIADPAAQKLVEWFILRHSETAAIFSRYVAFIADNPGMAGHRR